MKVENVVASVLVALLQAGIKIVQNIYLQSESFTAETARAEVDKILADVQGDEAIERRQFERRRADREARENDSQG